jgi:hypothetical protein
MKKTSDGKKGGVLLGKPHSKGGIKAVIKDDNRPVELEGGEIIINKHAAKKHWKKLSEINQSIGGGVPIHEPHFASGGEIDSAIVDSYKYGATILTGSEKDKIYDEWSDLVNMSYEELKTFYNSKEGKEAGLSSDEAKKQGIKSGRESARWIFLMKKTSKKDWNDSMWQWARRQISFIKRMKGVKGDLHDKDGVKTRKHTALLIWGHNPEK